MHHKQQSSFPPKFSGANNVLQLSLQSNRIEPSWVRMEVSSKWKLEVMVNKVYTRNNFLKPCPNRYISGPTQRYLTYGTLSYQVYIKFSS